MAELNEQGCSSIEQEIFRRAAKKRISKRRVNEVFEQKLKIAEGLFQNISKKALLQYAEYSVWVHFFENSPFPGQIDLPSAPASSFSPSSAPSGLSQKQIVKLSSDIRGSARMDMLFSPNLNNRKESHGARDDQAYRNDKYHYNQNGALVAEADCTFQGDFYTPLESPLHTKKDSYKPAPRGKSVRRSDPHRERQSLLEKRRYARLRDGAREIAMSVPFPRAEPRSIPRGPRNPTLTYSNVLPTTNSANSLGPGRVNSTSTKNSAIPVGPRSAFPLRASLVGIQPTSSKSAVGSTYPATQYGTSSPTKATIVLPPEDPESAKQTPIDLSKETAKFQEEYLKKKIVDLGYSASYFYKYLEDARMQANEEHPYCSRAVMHFLANSAVWKKFVKGNYPGSPATGHSEHCLAHRDRDRGLTMPCRRPSVHSSDRSSSRVVKYSESKAPIKVPVNPPIVKVRTKTPLQSSAISNCPKPNVALPSNIEVIARPTPETKSINSKTTQNELTQAFLIVQGKIMKCKLEDIKNVSFSWMTDCNRGVIEQSLDCKFYAIQRTPQSGLHLSAVCAEGYSSSIVEDNGVQFLNKWIGKVLEGEPIQMSLYWTQHGQDHGFMDYTMGANCGSPSSLPPNKAATGANTTPVSSRFRGTPASVLEESVDFSDEYESEVEIYCGEASVSTWGMKHKADSDGSSQVEKKHRGLGAFD